MADVINWKLSISVPNSPDLKMVNHYDMIYRLNKYVSYQGGEYSAGIVNAMSLI